MGDANRPGRRRCVCHPLCLRRERPADILRSNAVARCRNDLDGVPVSHDGEHISAQPLDPALVSTRKVGTLTFTRTSSDEATLQYTVDGIAVTKIVRREPLRYDNYTGTYVTTVYAVTSHCSNAEDNRALPGSFTIAVDHADNVMTISGSFAKGSACTYSGAYTQAGRIGAVASSYTCSDGDQGSMSFFEMTKRAGMFSGKLQGHSISDACDYTGAFTGLIPL